jgi:hypothetical protein
MVKLKLLPRHGRVGERVVRQSRKTKPGTDERDAVSPTSLFGRVDRRAPPLPHSNFALLLLPSTLLPNRELAICN